ncbi:hypothetical protein GALL_421210 [mine drainage metagenome]|uniref:Uncharacterized protein n=1 Tax=mine drainage metagenome TaxID=410659 RepID=A0A1J5Q868_9ZZZZ
MRRAAVVTRGACLARLAAAATPPPPPFAPRAFGAGLLAAGGFLGEPFGLLGFHFRFGFNVERLFLVERFLRLRRIGRDLRGEQRLGGLQRVHLFAAVDDE